MSVLVVASKVKDRAKKQGMRTSQEAIDALSKVVEEAIDAAVTVAEADNRKTIAGRDINVEVKED